MRKFLFLASTVLGMFISMDLSAQGHKIFLKIDGIEGDATQVGFNGQIDVWSMSQGAAGCPVESSNRSGCKINSSGFNLMTSLSKGTLQLKEKLYTGKVLPEVLLTFLKAGGDSPFTYYTILLKNVTVTSLQESASSELPTVSIELSPSSAIWTYFSQGVGGQQGSSFKFGWDFLKNVAIPTP